MAGESRGTRRYRTVADLMRRDVVSVGPGTSVPELARVLRKHKISGVPVLDEQGRALGTVSARDLLWLSDRVDPRTLQEGRAWRELDGVKVSDVMTPDAFGLAPTATVAELVTFFTRTGVHRALVMEDGKVVGLVSLTDLLGLIAGAREPAAGDGA